MSQLVSEAESFLQEGDKACKGGFFSSPNWDIAGQFYEKAAQAFKAARQYPRAVDIFIKASDSLQKGNAIFISAKQMEQAAALCMTHIRDYKRGSELYRRASNLYMSAGHGDQAAGAFVKGAKSIEFEDPILALTLYESACDIYEAEERNLFGEDAFKKVSSLQLKNGLLDQSISSFERLARVYEGIGRTSEVARANLSILIVLLALHKISQAEQTYESLSRTAFADTDEWETASKIFEAYSKGDAELLQSITRGTGMNFLDNEIIRLSRGLKVPKGGTGSVLSGGIDQIDPLDISKSTKPSVLDQYKSVDNDDDEDLV